MLENQWDYIGKSGIWTTRWTLKSCISELRWSLEECCGANQRRIIRTERWNHLYGSGTLSEEMKSKKLFFCKNILILVLNFLTVHYRSTAYVLKQTVMNSEMELEKPLKFRILVGNSYVNYIENLEESRIFGTFSSSNTSISELRQSFSSRFVLKHKHLIYTCWK